jgi:phosphohistidine phosphatase
MSDLRLILVQHGKARPTAEGLEAELTRAGRREVERVAAWVARTGLRVDRIAHSGKLRAVQTAGILADALEPPLGLELGASLKPDDAVEPVAEWLGGETGDTLMLVGHMPHLARLAGLLLSRDSEARPVTFKNGGVVCLERTGEIWSLGWAVVPELLPESP